MSRAYLVPIIAIAALVGALSSLVVVSTQSGRSEAADSDATQTRPQYILGEVELVELSDSVSFRAQPPEVVDRTPIAARGGSGKVVTAVAMVSPAAPVGIGRSIMELEGRPLIVFPGTFEFYRDLRVGDTGPDVEQLQSGLRLLGQAVVADGLFGAQTQAALRRVYQVAGYEPLPGAEVDNVELDRLLLSAERSAAATQRELKDAKAALAQAKSALSPPEDQAELSDLQAQVDVLEISAAQAREDLAFERIAVDRARAEAGAMLAFSEILVIDGEALTVGELAVVVGDRVPEDAIIGYMEDASLTLIGEVSRDAKSPVIGDIATISNGSGDELKGTVIEVESTGSSTTRLWVEVEDRTFDPEPGRSYGVRVDLGSTDGEVTAVPTAAIQVRGDGGRFVTLFDDVTDELSDVEVETGVRADGLVEVQASVRLRQGQLVIIGRDLVVDDGESE